MTLQDYVNKHRTGGLFELAKKVGVTSDHLLNLLYSKGTNPEHPKLPSMKLSSKLVEASGDELTMESLVNPVKVEKSPDRPRMKKGWKEAFQPKAG